MGKELDYQDVLDDMDDGDEATWLDSAAGGRTASPRNRDSRRAIEELREAKRLRQLLADYDFDDG